MDRASSASGDGEAENERRSCRAVPKCIPSNPFAIFAIWVSKSTKNLTFNRAFLVDGSVLRRLFSSSLLLEKRSVFVCFSGFHKEGTSEMEAVIVKRKGLEERRGGSESDCKMGALHSTSVDEDCQGRSSCSENLTLDSTTNDETCNSSSVSSSSPPASWPIQKAKVLKHSSSGEKSVEDGETVKQSSNVSEIEMMKERFSKLLLGEDMSGCGQGVCTALTISNAITNLCATLFGQLWRLEPLPLEKKAMWKREMELLVCVSDHIVEMIPSWQICPDGRKVEVMTCRPRSDIFINLPALRKLDNMLLDILDSFSKAEFWYADQGILSSDSGGSGSFRLLPRQEKWWLPVPCVPPGGLNEKLRKHLMHERECASQILKAAMSINDNVLAEMEVPESYLENLPKNGRACVGDIIYRYITSDQFNPEYLLDCLDLYSEHQALEIANRVEGSIYIWRRRTHAKPTNNTNHTNSKSSWEKVKDLMVDVDKRELLAERAEGLLLCLKQRFPGLSQTTLDASKIQYNKDIGKSILEGYSRVLESIAFNIVARIDDLICADDLTKHSDGLSVPKTVPQKRAALSLPYSAPVLSTPYRTAAATKSFSPAALISPATGDRRPLINGRAHNRGFSVKRVLTDYLGVEGRGRSVSNPVKEANCT